MIEQIKKLKDHKPKNQDIKNKIDILENEELSCLRDHNQSLLKQFKKLKKDKKSLHGKSEQLTNKEALINKDTMTDPIELDKYLAVKIQVMEKRN